jgi:hypothetical protein
MLTTGPRRSLTAMRPDQLERRLRERLDALGLASRAELLHVLMLPGFERADRIGEFWGYPESRAFCRAADRLRGGPQAAGYTLAPDLNLPASVPGCGEERCR